MLANRFSDISFQADVETMMSTSPANEPEFENTPVIADPQLVSNVYRMDADLPTQQQQIQSSSDDLFGAMTTTVSQGVQNISQQLELGMQLAMNDPSNPNPNNPDLTQQQNLEASEGPQSILDTALTQAETVHTRAADQSFEMKPAWA